MRPPKVRVALTTVSWRSRRSYALNVVPLLLGVLTALAFCQDLPEDLQDTFRQGVAAQKAGHWNEAAKAYQQVLVKGGKVAFVYNNLGMVYQQMGNHASAIAQFREAIRLQPNYGPPHILLGSSLLSTGQVLAATRELETAVRLQPREPLARWQLVKAYERSNRYAEAVEQLRALRAMDPQNPEYAYQLGRAYLFEAEASLDAIEQSHPGSARSFQFMGESYHAQGRTEESIQALQGAARIDPRLPDIHLELARIYLEMGKKDDARREIEQELAIVPESLEAQKLRQSLAGRQP